MWAYVVSVCENILSPNDIERGSYNDGYEYNADLTAKMVILLEQDIANNGHHLFDKQHKEMQAEGQAKQEQTGETEYVTMYPFEPETAEEFVNFLRNSGGFTIC